MRLRSLTFASALVASTLPVTSQAGGLVTRDAFGYRFCAGYFWSMEQCVVPQFRDAYRSAFLSMARTAATLDHTPVPLTEDEAVHNLTFMLRDVWNPGRCQDARSQMNTFGDECTKMLRE